LAQETKPWQSEKKRKYQSERRKTHRGFSLTADAKRRAQDKGLEFELEWEDIQRRIDLGLCEVTGIPFDLSQPRAWNAPSLDRADSKMGYTKGNTRVVLYSLNTMASDWGTDLILKIAEAIKRGQSLRRSNTLSRAIAERLKKRTALLGSTLFQLTWSEHVTPSGLLLSRLAASAARISDNDCGLLLNGWTTPTVSDENMARRSPEALERHAQRPNTDSNLAKDVRLASWPTPTALIGSMYVEANAAERNSLGMASVANLASWPTPQTSDMTGGGQAKRAMEARHGSNLNDFAMTASWPTPRREDSPGMATESGDRSRLDQLPRQAHQAHWQTPATDSFRSRGGDRKDEMGLDQQARTIPFPVMRVNRFGQPVSGFDAATVSGGQLNPAHSRWLMGLPPEWDACAPTAMPSSRKQRQK
jgi:hypothetical protein